jgi:hypothetical protein
MYEQNLGTTAMTLYSQRASVKFTKLHDAALQNWNVGTKSQKEKTVSFI